jgi:hypothetical protein
MYWNFHMNDEIKSINSNGLEVLQIPLFETLSAEDVVIYEGIVEEAEGKIGELEIANDGNVLCRLQDKPQESCSLFSSHQPENVCLQATKDVLRAKSETERELGGI